MSWENVTEEDEMEYNKDGELIHPVHIDDKEKPSVLPSTTLRNGGGGYGSYPGLYTMGGGLGSMTTSCHRGGAKRMRMFYP